MVKLVLLVPLNTIPITDSYSELSVYVTQVLSV